MTVDLAKDVSLNDSIHRDRVGENMLLHASDQHQWYYMSDMEDDDLIVFRNTDIQGKRARKFPYKRNQISLADKCSDAFHAAFNNPNNRGPLRESLEVRAVAFY